MFFPKNNLYQYCDVINSQCLIVLIVLIFETQDEMFDEYGSILQDLDTGQVKSSAQPPVICSLRCPSPQRPIIKRIIISYDENCVRYSLIKSNSKSSLISTSVYQDNLNNDNNLSMISIAPVPVNYSYAHLRADYLLW